MGTFELCPREPWRGLELLELRSASCRTLHTWPEISHSWNDNSHTSLSRMSPGARFCKVHSHIGMCQHVSQQVGSIVCGKLACVAWTAHLSAISMVTSHVSPQLNFVPELFSAAFHGAGHRFLTYAVEIILWNSLDQCSFLFQLFDLPECKRECFVREASVRKTFRQVLHSKHFSATQIIVY